MMLLLADSAAQLLMLTCSEYSIEVMIENLGNRRFNWSRMGLMLDSQ